MDASVLLLRQGSAVSFASLLEEVITESLGSITVVIFSPEARTFSSPTWYSYLCCRLSHLPLGSMPAWTASLTGFYDGEGIPEQIGSPKSQVMLLRW